VGDTVRLFNYFDDDGDGQITYAEFMHLLQVDTATSLACVFRPLFVRLLCVFRTLCVGLT
jgi:hypothetical protein